MREIIGRNFSSLENQQQITSKSTPTQFNLLFPVSFYCLAFFFRKPQQKAGNSTPTQSTLFFSFLAFFLLFLSVYVGIVWAFFLL